MNAQRLMEAAFLIGIAFGSSLVAQKPSLNYPSARRADVIDNYFGTKVADPLSSAIMLSRPISSLRSSRE